MPEPVLAVLAFPELPATGLDWIQSHRKRHDPRMADRVAPHFTFIFPAPDDPGGLATHLRSVAAVISSIPFILRAAMVVKDAFSSATHAFLVPDEGTAAMIRLHERLHSGRIATRRRLDVPFIPHITAGSFDRAEDCLRFVESVNRTPPAIAGTLRVLDIVIVEDSIRSLGRVSLG